MDIIAVPIAHEPVRRHFKVVLDNQGQWNFSVMLFHMAVKLFQLHMELVLHLLGRIRDSGIVGYIPVGGVDEYRDSG